MPYVFHHEAELAILIRRPAKEVSQADHMKAIFGYTSLIDVSARAEGRRTWRTSDHNQRARSCLMKAVLGLIDRTDGAGLAVTANAQWPHRRQYPILAW